MELRKMVRLNCVKGQKLIVQIVDVADDIQHDAELVDELDLALSFAQTAVDLNYVRPTLSQS